MAPKRISMSLFDEELKNLINASTKIFPITQEMVDTGSNPDDYEYGRIERSIYRWSGSAWEYIVADDIEILWTDVQEKPSTFPPSTHSHADLHTHGNKSLIDSITQLLVDAWNTAASHVSDAIRHITSEERSLWNTVSGKANATHSHTEAEVTDLDKYTQAETDALLSGKADMVHNHDSVYYTESEVDILLTGKSSTSHDHDGRYFTEAEVNGLLSNKSDKTHSHTDLHSHTNKSILDKVVETEVNASYDISELKYISDIRNGYTEGHTHTDLTLLESITQTLVNNWNAAFTHISDAVKHITSAERTLWNTVADKAEASHTHPYAPEVHTHPYADEVHSHTKTDITDLSLDWADVENKPATFPADPHTHDDRYYTESEMDGKLALKADGTTLAGHTSNTTVHVTQTDKDKLHEHTNKSVIDGLTDNAGTLQYNGQDIGASSGGVYAIKRQEFTATEGQTLFNLTIGSYTTAANRLSVYVWGVRQYDNAFTETSDTSFTLAQGLNAGDKVIAEWLEVTDIQGMYLGHAGSHATGGGDSITPNMIGADMSVIGTVKPSNGATMWYEEVV